MNTKITKENYYSVLSDIMKNGSEEEKNQVKGVMRGLAFFGTIEGKSEIELLEGKSFNEIIKNIEDNLAKEEEERKAKELLELRVAKEKEEKRKLLAKNFEVIKWSKGSYTDSFGIIIIKFVVIGLNLKNKDLKDIDAFEGNIYIYDKLGNRLAKLEIKSTEPLRSNKVNKLKWKWRLSTIELSNNGMQEVYETKAGRLQFKFEPTKVLYVDGTVINLK